jgi:hypothetical protein
LLLVHRDETKPVILLLLLLLLLLLFHVSDKEKENKPSRNHEADKENYTTAVFLVSLSVFYMD